MRPVIAAAVTVTAVAAGAAWPGVSAVAAPLPACPHFSDETPPDRSVSPWIPPSSQAPMVDLDHRLPAPGSIGGALTGDGVTVTFDPVPGAAAYRLWRNGQAVAWVVDFGQPTVQATDSTPCQAAFYTVVALGDSTGSEAAMGQLSTAYQLGDDGVLRPWSYPDGATLPADVTAYHDIGRTASGYDAGHGICAVDARVIPWGQRFHVPGYGFCYAADIGTWVQGDIVDVWLPGQEADGWGFQVREITFVGPGSSDPDPDPPDPDPDPPDPDPGECPHPAWSSGQVYTAGDHVAHDGSQWRAKWWTQGEEPGTTGEWGVWENLGPC